MGFALDGVVPWGRSFDEYRAMFGLTESDLQGRLLGCGDGPAGFNAELTRRGGRVTSVDPLYACRASEIRGRIQATYETVMAQVRANRDAYVWDVIGSVEELGRVRMAAMAAFLDDFEAGKLSGRYIAGELPVLPFADGEFDLALSSHFLFLYSRQLTEEFHLRALLEMLRVAQEVRVFPLLALDGSPSLHVGRVCERLVALGFRASVVGVPYEFQQGGDRMLVARRSDAARSIGHQSAAPHHQRRHSEKPT